MKSELILALISLILEKGLPTYIKWRDGVSLADPTLDDFENLKVKGMRDKLNEGYFEPDIPVDIIPGGIFDDEDD